MGYKGVLIAVKDLARSKKFYMDLMGLEVEEDFGANVVLSGGVSLQSLETWKGFVEKDEAQIMFQNSAMELYFEEEHFEDFLKRLEKTENLEYVHEAKAHRWGQRVVRFYDPDGHIVEVGEALASVVERFLSEGMTDEEVAERMDISIDLVKKCKR